MKKILALCAVLAAMAATAALTTAGIHAVSAFPAQSVAAGATATNELAVAGFKGLGDVCFSIGGVAAASSNRTVTVTVEGTNTVSGGWYTINGGAFKGASAGVMRVQCQADALPPVIRVKVENTTAASVVSGVLLAY